jgi:hypothetical protein
MLPRLDVDFDGVRLLKLTHKCFDNKLLRSMWQALVLDWDSYSRDERVVNVARSVCRLRSLVPSACAWDVLYLQEIVRPDSIPSSSERLQGPCISKHIHDSTQDINLLVTRLFRSTSPSRRCSKNRSASSMRRIASHFAARVNHLRSLASHSALSPMSAAVRASSGRRLSLAIHSTVNVLPVLLRVQSAAIHTWHG